MSKVIINNAALPPINIKGEPVRLLRFRLISSSKNIKSQWSTIFPLEPPLYEWISVTTSNSLLTPVNISFNGFNNSISWGSNTFYGTGTTVSEITRVAIGTHALRIGDLVYVRDPAGTVDYAPFSAQRDGIYKIVAIGPTTIDINLAPAGGLLAATGSSNPSMIVEAIAPSDEYDIYLQFNAGAVVPGYSWTYFGTFASKGSLAIPAERIPATATHIQVVLQRPTNPKKRYNINDESAIAKCPIVVAKTEIQFRKVVTR